MKRGGPLRRDPAKQREWERRSRKRLPAKSAKQREIDDVRALIKARKLAEAGITWRPRPSDMHRACVGAQVWPEVRCAVVRSDRAVLELHEVVKRSRWRAGATVPENCVLVCQAHHDATEAFPEEATRRGLLASHRGVDGMMGEIPKEDER